jgi:RNA polymerase sigma-70 factor (ECF subfamily)
METTMSDYLNSNPPALIRLARRNGDPGELFDVYRSYLKVLARLQVGKHLQGKTDASDVVQEVYLRATKGFEQFRGSTEQELLAWLRRVLARVVANLVRQYYGTLSRDVRLEQNVDQQLTSSTAAIRLNLVDSLASPSEQAMQKEQAVLLSNALESLPDDYREVVMLRHVEQLPFAQVAERLGRTIHSVKNIWPRALAQLKKELEGQP